MVVFITTGALLVCSLSNFPSCFHWLCSPLRFTYFIVSLRFWSTVMGGGFCSTSAAAVGSIQFWRTVPAYRYACPDLLLQRQSSAKWIPRHLKWPVCSPPRLSNGTAGILWGWNGRSSLVAASFAWLHFFEMGVVRVLLLLLLMLLKLSFTYIWTAVVRGWVWGCRERE